MYLYRWLTGGSLPKQSLDGELLPWLIDVFASGEWINYTQQRFNLILPRSLFFIHLSVC